MSWIDEIQDYLIHPFVLLVTGAFGFVCFKRWLAGGVCRSRTRIDGKTVVITGGNTGIGLETALELARRGGKIIIACRDVRKGEDAKRRIIEEANVAEEKVKMLSLDLASLASVRALAKELLATESQINYLINNAGLAFVSDKTKDGFDTPLGVNHLGHFLLTNLLLDRIKESTPSRIINVSSRAYETGYIDLDDLNFQKRKYSNLVAYTQSKLANILFTVELAKRLQGSGVSTFSLHPGVIQTELTRTMAFFWRFGASLLGPLVLKTPKQGAQTTLHCALEPNLEKKSGFYFSDCQVTKPTHRGLDGEVARKLWLASEKLVGIKTD